MNGSRGSQRKTLSERIWAIALQNTRANLPGEEFAALMIARQHGELSVTMNSDALPEDGCQGVGSNRK